MKNLELIPLTNYPYNLTWEELKDPAALLKRFAERWDLGESRLLLKKTELSVRGAYTPTEKEQEEIRLLLEDLQKLTEAVSVIKVLDS